MNRPDAIPLCIVQGHAVVTPEMVRTLFGPSYRLQGTERLHVYQAGRLLTTVSAVPGETPALFLDPRDLQTLHPDLPTRLRGPANVLAISYIERIPRRLRLPPSLQRAWELPPQRYVSVRVGEVLFTRLPVIAGKKVCIELSETDALAAGYPEHATGQLIRASSTACLSPAPVQASELPAKRLITETDIRRAWMEHRTIHLQPGQLITPSARMLGQELGVLKE